MANIILKKTFCLPAWIIIALACLSLCHKVGAASAGRRATLELFDYDALQVHTSPFRDVVPFLLEEQRRSTKRPRGSQLDKEQHVEM